MASSLGKFTAALMAASQENTMALAALNFDFSLYKVEAPREYQLLGSSLSEDRRRQAEGGSQHIAARRLGAVFRGRLPKVPHLLQAFGHRVSQIAAASKNRKKDTREYSAENYENHVFSKNVGIDGTSLWAAATSGPEALCVQLLACLLARLWSPPEAVSIWAEVLNARKAELHQEGMEIADITALNSTVTREQLAELDASTRSWLQTADAIKAAELIQFRLIIGNIDIPVNNTPGTYESVMEAWTESMKVADKLIAGVAQSVYNGGALLGLSAWHLYPDMSVYSSELSSGPPEKEVRQNDPLVSPGGILTVGLRPSDGINYGVRWSLPLAKLRYYGAPMTITRIMDANPSRVSITELMLAALGALAREWPETQDRFDYVCKFYHLLASRMEESSGPIVAGYKALGKAAGEFLIEAPDRRRVMTRIMAYGNRNGGEFLKDKEGRTPTFENQTFGMTNVIKLIEFIENVDVRQQLLCEVLQKSVKRLTSGLWMVVSFDNDSFLGRTGFPSNIPCQNSTRRGESAPNVFHRWTSKEYGKALHLIRDDSDQAEAQSEPWTWTTGDDLVQSSRIARRMISNMGTEHQLLSFTPSKDAYKRLDVHGNSVFTRSFCPELTSKGLAATPMAFKHYFGNPKYAAIYRRISSVFNHSVKGPTMQSEVEFDQIFDFMRRDLMQFKGISAKRNHDSIIFLGFLDHLYKNLDTSEVTVSLDVLRTPLSSKKCFSGFLSKSVQTRMENAFSAVAYLETGDQDLDPGLLNNVMAVIVGSSIYAAGVLSSDPHEDSDSCSLSRTFGNIGKPGVSLLIPPPVPQIKKNDTGEWNVINHEPWDGSTADHFNKTSLHLSLTEYRVPYTAEHQGQRDMQAFFQEAIVSVYDGNVWIGDIDIVKALSSSTATLTKVPSECESGHKYATQPIAIGLQEMGKKRNALMRQIVCADSWQELLDKSNRPMVLRCHENWVGRLAVTSISVQLGYRTLVLPKKSCKNGCFNDPDFTSRNLVGHIDVIIF
ncbi:hypothetical protein J7T55_000268 [Diaporthe amygdali]|uniref:uncharacterized protein n=1 Tax=Phomopsis amygdali TaxID=1214568 RepID=UPI0022FE2603|nr:uncharacterized protein J7T55_000268 [Diaporthe amygdali]KAJ0109343.1 hypothetical protein J7T55_000268 [Diaporthe amygdali]